MSDWKRESDGTIRWNVPVPWNLATTVKLAGCAAESVTLNGRPIEWKRTADLPLELQLPADNCELRLRLGSPPLHTESPERK